MDCKIKSKSSCLVAGLTLLLMAGLSQIFAEPHAFPAPFVPKQGHNYITFTDLPGSGSIKIFTINGEAVADLTIAPGELIKQWNVTNAAGKKLASGVYLFRISGNGQETQGKIVVIR